MDSTKNNSTIKNGRPFDSAAISKHNDTYSTPHTKPLLNNQQAQVISIMRSLNRPVDTLEFREHGIMHPSGRIKELIEKGYTINEYDKDVGRVRPIASYLLISEPLGVRS